MIVTNKNNLRKKDIVNNLNLIIGLSTKNTEKITNDVIDVITEILINQKKVNIKKFGSFNIVFKKQRKGRNPKTKEVFLINSRNAVKFKASDLLKKKINEM